MTSSTIYHVISRPSISGMFRKGLVEHTMGATHLRNLADYKAAPRSAQQGRLTGFMVPRVTPAPHPEPCRGFRPTTFAIASLVLDPMDLLQDPNPGLDRLRTVVWRAVPAEHCFRSMYVCLPTHLCMMRVSPSQPPPHPPPSAPAPYTLLWVVLRLLLARRCSKTITVTLDGFESGDSSWKKFCCVACASIGDSLSFVKRMKRYGLVCVCECALCVLCVSV